MSGHKNIIVPICTSCNRVIMPKEDKTKFACPSCGEIIIWRCNKCRIFCRSYKCPNCGFIGP